MAISLKNKKKKDFKKQKAQDEVIQIKRSEWENMQESVGQMKQFMEDLVNGDLEIEIVDDNEMDEVPGDEEIPGDEVPGEEIPGEEVPGEEGPEEDPELDEITPESGDEEEPDEKGEDEAPAEEKAEDADDVDYNEMMKDPEKRKKFQEFLKAADEEEAPKAEDEKPEEEPKKTGDEKPKRKIKRKTLKKATDKAIPDFTSRFEDTKENAVKEKALDSKIEEDADLTSKFQSRFN